VLDVWGFDGDKATWVTSRAKLSRLSKVEEVTRGKYVIIPREPSNEEAMEAVRRDGNPAVLGRGFHHPPEAVPNRDCL
jgi:hypothetical protein